MARTVEDNPEKKDVTSKDANMELTLVYLGIGDGYANISAAAEYLLLRDGWKDNPPDLTNLRRRTRPLPLPANPDEDDKKFHAAEVKSWGERDVVLAYKSPLAKGHRPGAVIAVKAYVGSRLDTDGEVQRSVFPATARYVGMWEDREQVAALQLLYDTKRDAARAKSKERTDTKKNRWREALEPARRAYARAPYMQKSLMLAKVVAFITTSEG